MPRPKKNTVTCQNKDGTTTTPEIKITTNMKKQIDALQLCVANLQIRVGTLEARQNPAIDNANNLLACMVKEGEKDHGDHV